MQQRTPQTIKLKYHSSYFTEKKCNLRLIYCPKCNTTAKWERQKSRELDCRKCKIALQYKCGRCLKTYKVLDSLSCHQKFKCNKKPSKACNSCDYKGYLKSDVEKHIAAKHTDPSLLQEYKCSKCDNSYTTQTHMRRHEKLCGRSPHLKCQFCPFATSYSHNFRNHIRNIHMKSNKIDYKICLCGKRYNYVTSLRKHEETCNIFIEKNDLSWNLFWMNFFSHLETKWSFKHIRQCFFKIIYETHF